MITYTKLEDYIVTRLTEETKAKERIRATALTSFFTCYLSPGNRSGLSFGNIKRWFDGGYLNRGNIQTLYDKLIISLKEAEAITGEDWGFVLPALELPDDGGEGE